MQVITNILLTVLACEAFYALCILSAIYAKIGKEKG